MNYVHCDYCDAHTPASSLEGRKDWLLLKIECVKLPSESNATEVIIMDFCPVCSHRLDDLPMMIKQGAAQMPRS